MLLFASGATSARVAFAGDSRRSAAQFLRFAALVAVPSILLAAATGIALRQFDPWELLLVSNWLQASRVALFPIWYTQVMVQIMIGLAVLFPLLHLTERIRARPTATIGALFAVALAAAAVSKLMWDTTELADKLPHLVLWNLLAGWLYWAVMVRREAAPTERAALLAVLAGTAGLMYLVLPAVYGTARFTWLAAALVLTVAVPELRLPRLARHVLLLINNGTFFVFLFHYYVFSAITNIEARLGIGQHYPGATALRFAAGLVVPIAGWVVITATRRAWQTTGVRETMLARRRVVPAAAG
ncbi:MAG: hypothetical protein R2761_16955 [Acidimicrobiales bacterium]